MAHDYPHISDTKFPILDTTNVYKYENNYDYDQYSDSVRIKMMNVSWCGDYDNVVYFETKADRDEWFDKAPGITRELSTMFRLYSDGNIKVDLPIDECMDYNYVMIDYGKLPNQETVSDNHIMFYFINDMIQASANTTSLQLSVDYWTTFINDMDISYVNLQRGHAPMMETTVDEYLSNPIENSEYMLSMDVNYGYLQKVASNEPVILNDDDMMLGFLTCSTASGDWSDRVPGTTAWALSQAYSAIDTIVTDISNWDDFRTIVLDTYPWFFKTVKGMFIVPRKLLTLSSTFDICGIECHHIETNGDIRIHDYTITKDKFDFPEKLDMIPKLYTFPYSAIEVNDFKGNTTTIKIEDTVGTLQMHTIMCDMYPFLNIEAYMTGLGGGVSSVVDFVNTYDNHYTIQGRDYDFNTKWSIPVFAVRLSAEKAWQASKDIMATAAKDNTTASANTNYQNVLEQNEWAVDRMEDYTNPLIIAQKNTGNSKLTNDAAADKLMLAETTYIHYQTDTANQSISAVQGMVQGANSGAALGASLGATAEGVGAVPGAIVGGFAGMTAGGVTATMSAALQISQNMSIAQASRLNIDNHLNIATGYANSMATLNTNYNSNVTEGDADTGNSIAARSKDTTIANANRSYNAQHSQTLIDSLPEFGQLTGTPDIISKPFGIRYSIVQQSKNAIRQAGEQFLRYGYNLNMEWSIESFNVMREFTYWKCNVVYCNDNGVYEGAQNMIKSILTNGTTVWRNPNAIGLTSIYSNI